MLIKTICGIKRSEKFIFYCFDNFDPFCEHKEKNFTFENYFTFECFCF